jgi:hypothetical protein
MKFPVTDVDDDKRPVKMDEENVTPVLKTIT